MRAARVVAVDLGASSGRVYVGEVGDGRYQLSEVARFANGAVPLAGRLHWDVLGLYRGVLDGLAAAVSSGPVDSVGVDSWAVDYGLLRADGSLLANPAHHRDRRTDDAYDTLLAEVGAEALWTRTGVALHRFNTLFQLATDAAAGHLDGVASVLLIPDLLGWWLSGARRCEITNASTTQLFDPGGRLDDVLCEASGTSPGWWAPPAAPGEVVGALRADVMAEIGGRHPIPLTAVASHDTASAVAAVPAAGPDFAYISCGTWSLVGVEVPGPVLSPAALAAGFTNERGVDGTIRLLRNVMGLWLLQQCLRQWHRGTAGPDLDGLLAACATAPAGRSTFDVGRTELLAPGDMPTRIAAACVAGGSPAPDGPVAVTRAILDSLAAAYRDAVAEASVLSGVRVDVIHLVGGGVHNTLLCQLTADACGVPVVAGPVEAAAIGNALVQASSLGVLEGDRWSMRAMVAAGGDQRLYHPGG